MKRKVTSERLVLQGRSRGYDNTALCPTQGNACARARADVSKRSEREREKKGEKEKERLLSEECNYFAVN